MAYPGARSGRRPWRGAAVLLLVAGGLVGAVLWVGPFRPIPAELRLLVQPVGDSASDEQVYLRNLGTPQAPRFALVLALRNEGGRVARPARLDLSVPAVFSLRSSSQDLQREVIAGNPLVRYQVPVAAGRVPPDSSTRPLSPGDTLWLEPQLEDYYCTALADSVPEFVPAPARDPRQLAQVQLFYSFHEEEPAGRQAGLVQLQLDPSALVHRPAATPPTYDVIIREPEVPPPPLDELRDAGTRTSLCGDPQQPLELFTAAWETPARGRFLVVYVSGAPRKHLFDLNRDSIVELEMWDANGDGRFEAARPARYPIPPFLLPERTAEELVPIDSMLSDTAWQRLFGDTLEGPFRFAPQDQLPPALRRREALSDTAWLRLFHDLEEGPFRFADEEPPRISRMRRARPSLPAGTPGATGAEPGQRAAPRPARPREPVPLGTPVPYPVSPGRPDTIPR